MIIRDPFDALTIVVVILVVFFAGWYAHMEYVEYKQRAEMRELRRLWLEGWAHGGHPQILTDAEPVVWVAGRRPFDWETDGF